jgi:hypothetical protein
MGEESSEMDWWVRKLGVGISRGEVSGLPRSSYLKHKDEPTSHQQYSKAEYSLIVIVVNPSHLLLLPK